MILRLFILSLFALAALVSGEEAVRLFREDFREVEAHIPASSADLTSDYLTLERLGPGADRLKLSHHPPIPNDPHYLWNGECNGPVLIAFPLRQTTDLSDPDWQCRLNTKNFGSSTLHLAVRSQGRWFAQRHSVAPAENWNEQVLSFHRSDWVELDEKRVTLSAKRARPQLDAIEAIGFAAPRKPNRSKDCIRLNWFEVVKDSPSARLPTPLPRGEFLENETPFLRSALEYRQGDQQASVRRGILVPAGAGLWACFDPDLLRWAVLWRAPQGQAPLTYDSMAAISYPAAKAKAHRAPQLRGEVLAWNPGLAGVSAAGPPRDDPREARLISPQGPVGPLPADKGHFQGISLRGDEVVIHYQAAATDIAERLLVDDQGKLQRVLEVAAHPRRTLNLLHWDQNEEVRGVGARLQGGVLSLAPANETRTFVIFPRGSEPANWPRISHPKPASPAFPKAFQTSNPAPKEDGPFTIRNQAFPESDRAVRAVDIAFRPDGTGLLLTLDGDVWQITDIESEAPTWLRVATGIFEPMSIETSKEGKVFVLGRDQITELIDTNGDGHIDIFRNASDLFQQTLHTRDYATSLAIDQEGNFYLGKGGIISMGKGQTAEMSAHRGVILKISPDGKRSQVLADGLRLPYVGVRSDGSVFASDQQGHHVPSTPLYLIDGGKPYYGFEPTNFRNRKEVTEPLLWYPYQINRSGAGFCETSEKAFPDLPHAFLHLSWNGRLFAIATPQQGSPFSWKLPLQFDFPVLHGATHPQSGRLYVAGLGISGYQPTTPRLVGLASVEQSRRFPAPTGLALRDEAVQVTFNRPFNGEETLIPGNPALRLFNIHRTAKYGSGHYRWDDQPGEHVLAATSFAQQENRFQLTFPLLRRSDLFDLQLAVTAGDRTFPLHLYTRPSELPEATSRDLRSLAEADKDEKLDPGDAKTGETLFTQYACIGCHSLEGQKLTGPPLNGVAQRLGGDQLRQAILDPTAEIAAGYEPSMPSFEGVIPPQDLEHLLAYLRTLR
ncbi:DUF6797 domain-containing protein [Roseibacillus ishigakijimensis]|uniref:C-type cytochrome n=1 Tax=Roseibacillus ishigakijimensis TaxID=454146 RepID=A0A934VJH1_9BACT|nr:DUF6797 domain-containing protein [Roseibacillus ishigakijimensis]MBK1832594.1 c-type cytochrome [Roseibacillus ishigakijimensis]